MFGGALTYYSLSVWCYVKLFVCWLLSLDALVCSLFVKLNFLITANLINHVVQTNKQKKKHLQETYWNDALMVFFPHRWRMGDSAHFVGIVLIVLTSKGWTKFTFLLFRAARPPCCSTSAGRLCACVTVLSLLLWGCWRGRFFADQSFCLSLVMDIYLLDTLGKHLVLWVALIYHRETWHVRKTVGVVQ